MWIGWGGAFRKWRWIEDIDSSGFNRIHTQTRKPMDGRRKGKQARKLKRGIILARRSVPHQRLPPLLCRVFAWMRGLIPLHSPPPRAFPFCCSWLAAQVGRRWVRWTLRPRTDGTERRRRRRLLVCRLLLLRSKKKKSTPIERLPRKCLLCLRRLLPSRRPPYYPQSTTPWAGCDVERKSHSHRNLSTDSHRQPGAPAAAVRSSVKPSVSPRKRCLPPPPPSSPAVAPG